MRGYIIKLVEEKLEIVTQKEETRNQSNQPTMANINRNTLNEETIAELCETKKSIKHNYTQYKGTNTMALRISEDKNNIKHLVKDIDVDPSNINIFRLGKYDPNKNRPIKVCFSNQYEALTVLKQKLAVPGVNIFSDQTKAQQTYFQNLKKQQEYQNNGENKILNSVPKIVDGDRQVVTIKKNM
ncbi:hypothetical protein JTB14_018118 [Gonioctena quinquepunctata]|nr:hypothetical protein JTB14_018118 [Gonioctena quinquepunctata]